MASSTCHWRWIHVDQHSMLNQCHWPKQQSGAHIVPTSYPRQRQAARNVIVGEKEWKKKRAMRERGLRLFLQRRTADTADVSL
jgi:hypothetical protein